MGRLDRRSESTYLSKRIEIWDIKISGPIGIFVVTNLNSGLKESKNRRNMNKSNQNPSRGTMVRSKTQKSAEKGFSVTSQSKDKTVMTYLGFDGGGGKQVESGARITTNCLETMTFLLLVKDDQTASRPLKAETKVRSGQEFYLVSFETCYRTVWTLSSSPSIGMTSRPGASAALVSRRSPPRRQIPKRGQDAIDIMRDASFGRQAVHVDLERHEDLRQEEPQPSDPEEGPGEVGYSGGHRSQAGLDPHDPHQIRGCPLLSVDVHMVFHGSASCTGFKPLTLLLNLMLMMLPSAPNLKIVWLSQR
ncbi:hypothetical protein SAY86_011223 [Trapa natans]|uniref:Uncharacterized protein n=1 Tax=Trapa natans TaxID=22666 RepID=A0AAN7LTG8_TRANT|nr:hypothetical protein SAY86_011223 [Trapa natans]